MDTEKAEEISNELVKSFILVRRAIGVLGLFLPCALITIGFGVDGAIQPSISAMYHTSAGDVLVGTMIAISVFLWSYVGYRRQPGEVLSDRLVSRLAALGAAGVALIPVSAPLGHAARMPVPLLNRWLSNGITDVMHYASAILFFLCLTLFSLVLFRRGPVNDTDKRRANLIYLACGLVLAASLALMIGYIIYKATLPMDVAEDLATKPFLFIVETAGVFAFGISWLVKGKTLNMLKSAASLVTG
ncbi:MAG: hypothetical protein ABI459_05280 [Deltaproteobacteria bacterium]